MKISITLLTALLLSLPLFSQNNAASKSILDKAFAGFEASQGIRLSFKTTTMESDGTAYPPESGVAYVRGNRFKLDMEAMDIWFDGVTQWVFIKEANEVNISNPTGQEIAAVSPLALLGMYKSGYTLKAPVSTTVNGTNVYQIQMTPAAGNKDFTSVTASIDKKTHTLVQVILTTANGINTKIDITSYNANHQFNEPFFRFDKALHPDVEIVDLR
ncbi:MAG: LolA-like putative outer membrane lipoprotein chaperone [Proteiniphilum sp.]